MRQHCVDELHRNPRRTLARGHRAAVYVVAAAWRCGLSMASSARTRARCVQAGCAPYAVPAPIIAKLDTARTCAGRNLRACSDKTPHADPRLAQRVRDRLLGGRKKRSRTPWRTGSPCTYMQATCERLREIEQ
jgi:hypothetical protein